MTFNSVYEITNPLTTVAGQHMIDYFSGNSLDSRWTRTFSGGTVGMSDSVNGGYLMSGTGGQNEGLWFNDINQFGYNGSVMIFVSYGTLATRTKCIGGLSDDYNSTLSSINKANIMDDTAGSCQAQTANGSTDTTTAMSGSDLSDGSLGVYKIKTAATSVEFSDSGVLEATIVATLPSAKMEPVFIMSSVTGTNTMGITYCEAYNT